MKGRVGDNGQAGNIVVVAMLSMAGVLSLAALVMLGVKGGMRASGHDRSRAVALYAAESGIAAGKEFLRSRYTTGARWNALVSAENSTPLVPSSSELFGNDVPPEQDDGSPNPASPFGPQQGARYRVTVLNNVGDPGFTAGTDDDAIVVLRSEGFGPNGAYAVVRVEVGPGDMGSGADYHCKGYAQKNIAASGSGFNPCLTLSGTSMTTFKPGD